MKKVMMSAVLATFFVASGLATNERSPGYTLRDIPNASISSATAYPQGWPRLLHELLSGDVSYFPDTVDTHPRTLKFLKPLLNLVTQSNLSYNDIISAQSITCFVALSEIYLIVKHADGIYFNVRFKRDTSVSNDFGAINLETAIILVAHTKEDTHIEHIAKQLILAGADGSEVA
jgi:hypothetical protein